MKKLVLFGAGKIGRSFIGQLFAQSGYEVVFIDIDEKVINELNSKKQYKVVIKSNGPDRTILVQHVRGVQGTHKDKVVSELVSCDIAAVSVGQRGLTAITPVLAKAITKRKNNALQPLDIIIAENMRNADEFILNSMNQYVQEDFPLKDWVGLVETSIGKMVPIMPEDEVQNDPLLVYAEPYNTLIVDGNAFKNSIPDVKGLAPKDNIKAWVDRKSYIHNFGHAAVAYAGYAYHSFQKYIYEALENPAVKSFAIKAMNQSAAILRAKYPEEFSEKDLEEHINDLIARFENKALKDTIYRVGCDLKRKLSSSDRIISPMLDGLYFDLPVDYIMLVFAFGFCFEAKDEQGKRLISDEDFSKLLQEKGIKNTLKKVLMLDAKEIMDSIAVVSFKAI
ncbi:hypothetical protein [Draconibacterium orientale]|uniref:mannitol dehydrogenase family protein n=1 Tax=Draconibacterium orientale TaxID=1168034 RepID=UPI0029C01E31|nr:hypothetical protein [Draconibacterium orientale]